MRCLDKRDFSKNKQKFYLITIEIKFFYESVILIL